jgi:hypothetical protein
MDCANKLVYSKRKCPGVRLALPAVRDAIVPLVQTELDRLGQSEIEARAAALTSGTEDKIQAKRAEIAALEGGIAQYNRDYYVTKNLPIPEAIFLETLGAWSAQLQDLERQLRILEGGRKRADLAPDVLAEVGAVLVAQPAPIQNAVLHAMFKEVILERAAGHVPKGSGYRHPARVVRCVAQAPAGAAAECALGQDVSRSSNACEMF